MSAAAQTDTETSYLEPVVVPRDPQAAPHAIFSAFCVSYRRIGGLRFLKIGRLPVSWCVTAGYRPLRSGGRA